LALEEGPKAVLHVLPFVSFSQRQRFTPVQLRERIGMSGRPFLEGIVSTPQNGRSIWCLSVFTNGAVEAVFGTIVPFGAPGRIHSKRYEQDAIEHFSEMTATLVKLELAHPYLGSLSLVGVKGYSVWVNQEILLGSSPRSIDQDVLIAPEILLEDLNVVPWEILRSLFDSFWHAAGYFEWPNG